MRYAIGIDIGVTNIKSAIVSEGGEILLRDQSPTHADKPTWPESVKGYISKIERDRGES